MWDLHTPPRPVASQMGFRGLPGRQEQTSYAQADGNPVHPGYDADKERSQEKRDEVPIEGPGWLRQFGKEPLDRPESFDDAPSMDWSHLRSREALSPTNTLQPLDGVREASAQGSANGTAN